MVPRVESTPSPLTPTSISLLCHHNFSVSVFLKQGLEVETEGRTAKARGRPRAPGLAAPSPPAGPALPSPRPAQRPARMAPGIRGAQEALGARLTAPAPRPAQGHSEATEWPAAPQAWASWGPQRASLASGLRVRLPLLGIEPTGNQSAISPGPC